MGRFCFSNFFSILSILALAMIDLPALIVSAIVKDRLLNFKGTPLPDSNNLEAFAITLIVLSSFTISLSCCCGQKNWQNSDSFEEPRQSTVRHSLMGLIMLTQFAIGISVLATEKDLTNNVRATTIDIFQNYNDTSFAVLQSKFQCCGLSGPDYWQGKLDWLPSSCCNPIIQTPCNVELSYDEGCLEKIVNYLAEQNRLLGWITIGFLIGKFALFLLLLVGIPCCVWCVTANSTQHNTLDAV